MSTVPALSPERTRQSVALARALSAAARTWGLYPPEHPSVQNAVRRFADTVREITSGLAFTFGVTPRTLLVAGHPVPEEQPVAEAARLLHDRDLLQVTFVGDVPVETLQALLTLLTTPAEELRAGGGPAKTWDAIGQGSIMLEQIDYEKILEDREAPHPAADRHDDIWRSLVNSIGQERTLFDEQQQRRLLEISRSVFEIGELASAAIAPKCNADGSPLITTQAATVLALCRHLAGVVTVMEPERVPEVMRNLAAATLSLDPQVVLQMMQMEEGHQDTPLVKTLAASFDDDKVAELLAGALSRDGRASARLAQVLDTIVSGDERKQRVLALTRSLLTEQDFGQSGEFTAVWSSMEELLLGYNEKTYVSAAYQAVLDEGGARAETLASRDLPAELAEWVETLGLDNVRALSVTLITDLLRIEEDPDRAADIIHDMAALLEDLLLAGDFANAAAVLRELRQAAERNPAAVAAMAAVGESASMRDAAALLGDLDTGSATAFSECCELIGHIAIRALLPWLESETDTSGFTRASDLIRRFGTSAVTYLAPLADDDRWFVQRNVALLLGATRSPDAVPALQSLLRGRDRRVVRQAVAALAGISHSSAARAIQMVLRAATGANRAAVVEALVAERDLRVVPMLVRILTDSDPFGEDHQTVLDTLAALRQLKSDHAVPSLAALLKKRKFFAWRKARAFKTASVDALVAIGTAAANAALDDAARTGDRLVRKIIREHRNVARS